MNEFSEEALTQNAFLGGQVHIWQPRKGYRAGVDPVLLAACVPAKAGQSVLELGCGVGTAVLCLGARVPGLDLIGVEHAPDYAALAVRNGDGALTVVQADIGKMPLIVRDRQFDHVIANPPFFDRTASRRSDDPAREVAHGEATPLHQWLAIAAKRLRPKGMLHFIHRAERLPELLRELPQDVGSVEVLPITSRNGRAAERIILRARKNGRGAFRLHAPLVMHQGAAHRNDRDKDYSAEINAVLREGAALEF